MIELEKTGRDKKSISIKKKHAKKSSTGSVQVMQGRFYDELRFAETEEIDIEFDKLITEITKQGEKFSKKPTAQLLKTYKSMIREFLKYITDNMFRVEHYTGGKLKHKIYTVTKIVDKKLSALTRLVLSQQAQNIDLLSTLDEIRGLLIDLYK